MFKSTHEKAATTSILFTFLPFILGAGVCQTSYTNAPRAPAASWPPPNVGASFFLDDATKYPYDEECFGPVQEHSMPSGLDQMASLLVSDGSFGTYRDGVNGRAAEIQVPEWLDRDLVLGGLDDLGADRARLVGFKGHGRVPNAVPGMLLQAFAFPTRWDDQLGEYHCGPWLSFGNPIDGYQSTTGLGRQYSGNQNYYATHGLFFSSCIGQPPLMFGLARQNNLTQSFGFAYSPSYLSSPTISEKTAAFYVNSGIIGNARAWVDMFDTHPNEDGTLPAGATATTFGLPSDDLATLHMANTSPPLGTHMLRLGRFVARRLPDLSPTVSWKAKVTFNSPCRVDAVCGSPDLELTGACPSPNSTEMPLEGTPTRLLTSERDPNTEAEVIQFVVNQPSRTVSDLAEAVAAISRKMTQTDIQVSQTLSAATLAISGPRYQYSEIETGEGIAFWYDRTRDRLRVIDYIVEDELDPGTGQPIVIEPQRAAEIARDWFSFMEESGGINLQFWNLNRPVIGEIAELDLDLVDGSAPSGTSRLWAYTISIFRSVNGVPFVDQSARIWIHRSGKVVLVDASGLSPATTGEPSVEIPSHELPPLKLIVPRDIAIRRASSFVKERTGFGGVRQHDVLVYRKARTEEAASLVHLVSFDLRSAAKGENQMTGGSVTVVVSATDTDDSPRLSDDN